MKNPYSDYSRRTAFAEGRKSAFRQAIEIMRYFEDLHLCNSCDLTDAEYAELNTIKATGKEARKRIETLWKEEEE